ncbi:MAG: tetratricopeptide repeat protein [Planctomycetes bacterium]|nr:tetratricopeptide repeat protein [Planctomycetota bacterium]
MLKAVGRYRLQEELGRGANGVVYRAWDPERSEDVAVKVLTEVGEKKRARFETEVRTLARLRHPNLVTVLAYGEHQGHPYLVMELVRGGSLQHELEQRGGIPAARAVRIAQSLAQAVAYAHSCSVIHRDIKPDNVLITSEGEPKLTDFGMARDLDATHARLTQSRASMGTPGYWAPEQAAGKTEQIGELTDVYGLGATLYAMLTGGPPAQGRTYLEFVQRTLNDPPIPPRRLAPEVWPELEAVCLRALEKEPARRHGSATSLARALHASLHAPQGRSPAGRAPWVAAGVVGAALFVGLVCWWASEPATQDSAAAQQIPSPPSPLLAQGKQAFAAQDYEALRAIADELLAEQPSAPWGLLWRGAVRRDREDWEAARADLSAAFEQSECAPSAAIELARVHLGQGDQLAAESWARRALELRPGDTDAAWVLAHVLLRLERPDEALDVLEGPSSSAGPGQFACCMLRGEVLLRSDRPAEAEEVLRRAAALRPQEAGPERMLALLCASSGRMADAEAHFARALEVTDEEAILLNDRARVRLRGRDLQGALADAERAVALAPSSPHPLSTLGQVLLLGHETARALECFTSALALDPDHPYALMGAAEVFFERMDCEQAAAALNRVLAKDPANPQALFLRGLVASELGDRAAAVRDLEEVARLEGGTEANTFASLGTLYREAGQLREALAYYDRALAIDRRCFPAHYGRGLCLIFVPGGRAEALAELRGAAASMPPDMGGGALQHWIDYLSRLPADREPVPPRGWLELGRQRFARGEPDAAAQCFTHALELGAGGQRAEALYGLGKCRALLGHLELAEQEFTRSLWARPNADALVSRGMIRIERGDLRGALGDFNALLKTDPDDPLALMGRGTVLAKSGDVRGSLVDFTRYVQLQPEDPNGWRSLALSAFAERDPRGAIQAATQALTLGLEDPGLLELRGSAHFLEGAYQEAHEDFSRALTLEPRLHDARAKRILTAQHLGDHAQARDDARALLGEAPDDPGVMLALAESLEALGEGGEALSYYQRALARLEPGSDDHAKVQAARDRLAAALRAAEGTQ